MQTLLNPDFDLNTFYWQYVSAKDDQVTYTVECFVPGAETAFMVIQTSFGQADHVVKLVDETIDRRIVEALTMHFNALYMLEDGHQMLAEYVAGASGQLHKHEQYGQAIFGCDLEEAYADLNCDEHGIPL